MPEHDHIHIEINTGTIIRFVLVILFFLFLYLLKDVFIIFFFALIIASAIAPFANWLEEKGLPRLLGVLVLFLTVLALVGFLLSLVVPFVSQEVSQLLTGLPETLSKVSSSLEKAQEGAPKYFDFVSEIQNILETFSTYLQQSAQSIIGLVVSIFGGLMSFIAILIISFYLSVTKNGIENFLGSIVPEKYEPYAIGLWKRSEIKVGRWLQGQLLLGLIMGLVVYVGLSLMGIKYALLLAFLAAVLEIVPIVGPVLAAIPAVFLAFLQGPSLGLWVVLFYVAAQQLENHLLVPVVLGKTTGLNPVVVIIALLVGQQLAGIPGMILSVPLATVIVELLDDFAKHKESRRTVS